MHEQLCSLSCISQTHVKFVFILMSLQIKTKKTLKEKGKVLRNAKLHDMVITFFNVPVFFVCT